MADPLSLLPLAAAAAGGSIDGHLVSQLAAAGLTLLQRHAGLVRALSGRRAAILLPTSPPFFVALAACEGRGAVLVNPLAAPREVAHQCADADVGAVFTVGALAARVPPGIPVVLLDDAPATAGVTIRGETRVVDLGSHVGLTLEGRSDAAGSDEEAAIVYTSAMEGTPLGAILTHRNLIANARSTVVAGGMTADDHTLALLPFAHLFGLTVTGSAPLLAGGRVTTMARFNPARALELLERGRISQLVGVPAVFQALVAMLARRNARLAAPALRLVICGGAVLPRTLQDQWFDLTGVELRQGYGLTEAAPVCLFNRADEPNRRGSLGVPFPDVEVSVRDVASGDVLPDGVEGELCVRGANVSPGYVSGGERGLGRWGDWLRTGDRGLRHPDGSYRFTGLYKPMFTRSGFNVYPREVEQAVRELPGVEQVRVIPVPEPTREHDFVLEIFGDVDPAAVRQWCEVRLAAYKQPVEVRGA